jgi:hypothetical protein
MPDAQLAAFSTLVMLIDVTGTWIVNDTGVEVVWSGQTAVMLAVPGNQTRGNRRAELLFVHKNSREWNAPPIDRGAIEKSIAVYRHEKT